MFNDGYAKDTENAEEHRRDILTIQMMREEFDVFDAPLRALKRKEYRMMHSYLIGEKEMQDIADEEHMLCEPARNKISKTKKPLMSTWRTSEICRNNRGLGRRG